MTKAEAIEAAEALRRKLHGRGWRIDVWLIGSTYCYSVVNADVIVEEPKDSLYHAAYRAAGNWSHAGFRDPNAAVRDALRRHERWLGKMQKSLEAAKKRLEAKP